MAAAVKAPVDLVRGVAGGLAGAVGLGGGGSAAPAAAPAAAAPGAQFAKSDADSAAAAMDKTRGRSGAAAGVDTTAADQMQRGLLKQKQRTGAAANALLG